MSTPVSPRSTIVAACDIGTFSGLILVAKYARRRWEPLVDEQHTIDLLAGGAKGDRLSTDAIGRARAIVARFDQLAQEHECERGAVVCTAATRSAPNRDEMLRTLRSVTKHRVRAISAKREGALSARGALIGVPKRRSTTIVVDVGGGSTETMTQAGDGWTFRGIPWGASRATAAWADQGLTASDLMEKGRDLMSSLRLPEVTGRLRLVGVGGTISTLAAINARLRRFDIIKLHGRILKSEWIERTANRLTGLTEAQIARLIPFDPKRARVLTAGTFLWAGVLNRFGASEITVSTRGLRWGVAAELVDTQLH